MESALKLMTKNLVMVHEDASLDVAYTMMKKNGIRHLPVLNEHEHVVGVLSDRDLQRALRSNVVGVGIGKWESCEFDPAHCVADYMSWPVKTVALETSVKAIVGMMLKEKVSSYLVTSEGQITGIITTDDLLKYLAKILDEERSWKETLEDLFAWEKTGAYAQALADSGI